LEWFICIVMAAASSSVALPRMVWFLKFSTSLMHRVYAARIWIIGATHKAQKYAREGGLKDWVQEHCRRKWRWVGKFMRGPSPSWARKTTEWRDSSWPAVEKRPDRRRWMKFEDILKGFCKTHALEPWQHIVKNSYVWNSLEQNFVRWASRSSERLE